MKITNRSKTASATTRMISNISDLRFPPMTPAAQPEPLDTMLLLPGAAPPVKGEITDRAYKRRYVPKTYKPHEVEAARRVIAHWNRTFPRDLTGSKRANPADACNIKAYVKMIRLAAKSGGVFDIDERVVIAAIDAYRRDPERMRVSCWTYFRSFCTCEMVDACAARVRRTAHRREQPKRAKRETADRAAQAKRIATHKGWDAVCVTAAERRVRLLDFLRASLGGTGGGTGVPPVNDPGPRRAILELDALIKARDRLSDPAREAMSKRARTVFDVHYSRPVGARPHDAARLEAIELALMDLYPKTINEAAR